MTIEENADWLVAAMDSAGVRRPFLPATAWAA